MAGSKLNNYSIGDSNIQSVMLTLDKTFKGLHKVSLTNYNTTSESQIAAGSIIEVNGAQYKFDSNESITGSPSDGTVYIMAVPSGDSVTCAYTNTAPTWSDSKQGWYGTGGTVNNRYLEFFMTKSSAIYDNKNSLVLGSNRSSTRAFGLYRLSSSITHTTTGSKQLSYDIKVGENKISWNNSSGELTILQSGLYAIYWTPGTSGSGTFFSSLTLSHNFTGLFATAFAVISTSGAPFNPLFGSYGYVSIPLKNGDVLKPTIDISVAGSTVQNFERTFFYINQIN